MRNRKSWVMIIRGKWMLPKIRGRRASRPERKQLMGQDMMRWRADMLD